jgi:hypothetical protein
MRMIGVPVKKSRGRGNSHPEKEIKWERLVPMGEAKRLSQTTWRRRLKFSCGVISGEGPYQDMGLDASLLVMWA